VITYTLSLRKKLNGQIPSFYALLPLESFQYGAIALLWLFSKGHLLKLIPFCAFSALQVAFFTSNKLLPGNNNAQKFEEFVSNNSRAIQRFVGWSDLLLFLRLLLDVFMIVPGSMICLVAYGIFLRIRFAYIAQAQETLRDVQAFIDNYANKPTSNPKIKEYWLRVKDALQTHQGPELNFTKPVKEEPPKPKGPRRTGSASGLFIDEEPVNLPSSDAAADTAKSTAV
jgi:Transmembrane protein 33/Nucleoporin POM33